jgi:hypothetical protein
VIHIVMAGLAPAIHAFAQDVDARDKRGHDAAGVD